MKKAVKILCKFRILSSFILSNLIVIIIQIVDWVNINGWAISGRCTNHFGESYECDIIYSIAYIFQSPFVAPVILVIWGICYIGITLIRNKFFKSENKMK